MRPNAASVKAISSFLVTIAHPVCIVVGGMAEVVGHAAHPAFAEAAKSGKFGVKAQALGVEAHQEVVFRQLGYGSQGGGADYAVIGHGGGALQHTGGIAVAVVHRRIEELPAHGIGQLIALVAQPKGAIVDFTRLLAAHLAHLAAVAVGQRGALGNAPVGFATGVARVVDVAAFVGDEAVEEFIE